MGMDLSQVVPWGRTLDEYKRMFSLTERDLQGRILGCGDGPASFNAEMMALGRRVISIDPLYDFTREQIEQRVHETYQTIVGQLWQKPDDFVWDEFKTPDGL